jgi:hypothetical protein
MRFVDWFNPASYVGIDPKGFSCIPMQIEARRVQRQRGIQLAGPLPIETTIAVLVETLKAGQVIVPPSEIAGRLAVRGLAVTVTQVNRIFSEYGIEAEKKTSRSR